MLTCAVCGSDEEEGSGFCGTCGAPLVAADPHAADAAPTEVTPPEHDAPSRTTAATTLTCSECGNEEPEGSGFCGRCGAPLAADPHVVGAAAAEVMAPEPTAASESTAARAVTCAVCGNEEPEGSGFCGRCGAPLVAVAPPPAPAPPMEAIEIVAPPATDVPPAPAWSEPAAASHRRLLVLIAALGVLFAGGAAGALLATGVIGGSSGASESSFVRTVNDKVLAPLDQADRAAAAHASTPHSDSVRSADGGRIVRIADRASAYLRGLSGLSSQQRREVQLLLAFIAANQSYGRALAAFTPDDSQSQLALEGSATAVRATLATVHGRLSAQLALPLQADFVALPATTPEQTTSTTTSTSVPPAPAPRTLLPAESRTEMTQQIRSLLLQFHQDIVARDTASAWRLLSIRKRRQELVKDGYGNWARAQESLAPYLDPSGIRVRILSVDRASGIVTVDVTGMKWSAPGASCTEWSGITWVKYENDTWKYDPGYSTTAARKRAWASRYDQLLGTRC